MRLDRLQLQRLLAWSLVKCLLTYGLLLGSNCPTFSSCRLWILHLFSLRAYVYQRSSVSLQVCFSTCYHTIYILLKSPQTSTHKKVYVNTHKICGQVFWEFLQPSLRWILKKEQRSWLPHNLKYVGKIGYRTLHPSFFFHFLDAKKTLCWPNTKVTFFFSDKATKVFKTVRRPF